MLSDLSEKLKAHIVRELEISGGWLSFDRFMALALYQPGLGYYANDSVKFGSMPGSGSDYVLPGITILRFAGGKVLERWSSADMPGLMMQIGAIPMLQAA